MTPEQLVENAREYAEKIHPFKPALNGKGEEIEQRIGQRAYGVRKWEKQIKVIVKDWIAGYNSRQKEVDELEYANKFVWAANKEMNQEIDSLKAELADAIEEKWEHIKDADETIKALQAQLQSLSSDTRTLEEVLKPYEEDAQILGIDFTVIIYNDAIKAMQEVSHMARAKVQAEAKGIIEGIEEESHQQQLEIQSLQQQSSEHEKQYLEIAKIAREAAEENERLKAELEQHRWIPISERNPNKKDCNKKGMVETWDDVYQCSKMAGIENILSQPVRFTHFRKQLLPSPPKP